MKKIITAENAKLNCLQKYNEVLELQCGTIYGYISDSISFCSSQGQQQIHICYDKLNSFSNFNIAKQYEN